MLRFRSSCLLLNFLLNQLKFEKELNLKNSIQRNQCASHGNELTNQIILSIKKSESFINQQNLSKIVKMCYNDQKNFGHLFFRLIILTQLYNFYYIVFLLIKIIFNLTFFQRMASTKLFIFSSKFRITKMELAQSNVFY